jgi:hypothetical protein
MPKKKFEEMPYNPIAADLAREVGASGRISQATVLPIRSEPQPSVRSNVAIQEEISDSKPVQSKKVGEPTVTKRFVVTRSEDDELTEFLLRLQRRAGTKVSLSVFARALMNMAMQAEEQIINEIGERFSKSLPSTHDSIAYADFEDRWMKCLASALRKLPRHHDRA